MTYIRHFKKPVLRLTKLDDVSHRKLQSLGKYDPDCANVINWLRQNKHRFRMEIIEPAAVSVTVPNKSYVNAVEACFNGSQLRVRPSLSSWLADANTQHTPRRLSPSATKTTGFLTSS
jgi:hypothetical protein